MKKIVLVSVVAILTLFISCSEKTPKEQIEVVVHTYIEDMLKNEPNAQYQIDSIKIDNITEKDRLENEAVHAQLLAKRKLEKAKELGEEYKSQNDLQAMMKSLGSSNDDTFVKSSQNDLDKMKAEFERLQAEILKLGENAQKWANEAQKADSIQLLYYDVTAKGTITAPNGVQKNAIIPFHISKEYKIIKEPTELRQEQLELMGE